MRKTTRWLVLLAGTLSIAGAAIAEVHEVRVIRVLDGDTVEVADAHYLYFKVRLHGIDAPECSMPFGPQAQRFLVQMTQGRMAQMATKGRDRYGRIVATLAVSGQDVGLALVRAGFAWRDGRYDRPHFKGQATPYATAQRDAQMNSLGLWGSTAPMAPWVWRTVERSSPKRIGCASLTTWRETP
jgi:endonuclease YncB( thermonuclease family)